MRLLVLESNPLLGHAIQRFLHDDGLAVDLVDDAEGWKDALHAHHYDMAILDFDLPDHASNSLITQLQAEHPRIPFIASSASCHTSQRIAILDMGADDVLLKPFDLHELAARLHAVARRLPTEDADAGASTHGPLTLYPLKKAVSFHGQPIPLSHREYSVLEVLVRRKNQVLTRAQIEEALYGWDDEVASNTVEVYIHLLRRKLGTALIHTIRGVGYQLAGLCLITNEILSAGLDTMH